MKAVGKLDEADKLRIDEGDSILIIDGRSVKVQLLFKCSIRFAQNK